MGGVGGTTVTSGGNTPTRAALELYKLEYQRASIRYENIYKAVWQVFSYLSAVTAAFLAFGGDRFQENLFWFLTCLPLVFWFWGTFIPLDRYGNNCSQCLAAIERLLNRECHTEMRHYRGFEERRDKEWWKIETRPRVKNVVRPIFGFLTGVLVYHLVFFILATNAGAPVLRERPTEVKIITVSPEEFGKLLEKTAPSEDTTPAGEEEETRER